MAPGKKQRDAARPPGGQKSTLERFQGIIRRVVSKDDERSSLVDDIACVVGAEILEGLRRPSASKDGRRLRACGHPSRRLSSQK